ncbi:MAG: dihydrofolate reductase [Bacteroidales bacterium]|nr:MAG: dihydrofolate reductase [Bacteroidales bacterium]
MKKLFIVAMTALTMFSCADKGNDPKTPSIEDFNYKVEEFDDMGILRYRVPNIDSLSRGQKELLYYLTEAALQGRDIIFDQNCEYNLPIRRTLEGIYTNAEDKSSDNYKALELYLKKMWVSNGIHHHYSGDKFVPKFTKEYFIDEGRKLSDDQLKLKEGESIDQFLELLTHVIFDADKLKKRTNQASGVDLITTSAGNYYQRGITQSEAEDFYAKMKNPNDQEPVMYGLNSKLVKKDGVISESVYRVGGLYSKALEKVVFWLEKASAVAENKAQKDVIDQLITYYNSGSLKDFDAYSILWVNDTASQIDFVNGFTESYGDPLGMKGSWESLVNFKNLEATKRTEIISGQAQWFEQNAPTEKRFKKDNVKGITAKVITAAILAGDCYPTTPIGINLPNSNWIRAEHGSKSVTIENITEAYDEASKGNGFAEEFYFGTDEVELVRKYSNQTGNLHTDLHECLGHASGKLLQGVDPDALKAYGSSIEEARADLFALYFMGDPKMVDLGLLPDTNAYKAEYYTYLTNGLMTQLTRIVPGDDIEEAHMRNRQLIAQWVLEKSKDDRAVEMIERDGKHFVKVNDYKKIKQHFGELLSLIQTIKSTGDYQRAHDLVETYGVKVDKALNSEVRDRYNNLNIKPYKGFVNPVYTAVFDKEGKFIDINVDYTEGFAEQHLRYSKDYSNLD